MQNLEKILEEIDETIERYGTNPYIDVKVTELCYGLNIAKDIISKHMNDGWNPVEERLPEESGYYRVAVRNTELGDITEETAWFAHVDDYDMDESEWRELYEYEEVIAWRELSPYRPEPLETRKEFEED